MNRHFEYPDAGSLFEHRVDIVHHYQHCCNRRVIIPVHRIPILVTDIVRKCLLAEIRIVLRYQLAELTCAVLGVI